MNQPRTTLSHRRWAAAALTTLAAFGLIVSTAGAAQRVVLGEYFTNLY